MTPAPRIRKGSHPMTARRALCLCLALASLGGCGMFKAPREAAVCSGPRFALNTDRWAPTAEELGK